MSRPKGVIFIAIYFVILAVLAGMKLDIVGLSFSAIYCFLAYRLFLLKRDGLYGVRIVCWINLVIVGLSTTTLLLSIFRKQIPAYPILYTTLFFTVSLVVVIQGFILSYLGRRDIALQFQRS